MLYVSKKTERIVAAVFVVTDLIKDNYDFIKVIHDQALVTGARPVVFSGADTVDMRERILERQADLMTLASVLQMGSLSGRLSINNVRVIREEISRLIAYCEELLQQLVANLPLVRTAFQPQLERYLSDDFFAVAMPQKREGGLPWSASNSEGTTSEERTPSAPEREANKGRETAEKQPSLAATGGATKPAPAVGRTAKIIGLLARLGEASIKDVASEFPGVSEKTIQRDMARLIEEKKVRTEGKRRWTKYFLM